MIDKDTKNAILAAEAEFERRENLSRDLAEAGVHLVGRITSPAHKPAPAETRIRSGGPDPDDTEEF